MTNKQTDKIPSHDKYETKEGSDPLSNLKQGLFKGTITCVNICSDPKTTNKQRSRNNYRQ